ncbi:MAG: SGNH/GDSL hydrolase family protein [Clostridia bacterium]|nr:SGNH/GDSL hydrolase family protein [Clostridia bacterium]
MKLAKWIFMLSAVAACCLLLSACSKTEGEPQGTESNTETKSETEAPKLNLTIDGKDIGEYKIVYAHSPLENKVGSNTGKTVGEDLAEYLQGANTAMDFDYQTATRLQTLIQEKTGKTPSLEKDSASSQWGDREILVGETTRIASKNASSSLATDSYVCKTVDTRYVICGNTYGTTYHAVDAIEEMLNDAIAEGIKTLDLKAEGDIQGTYTLKKVACVGDSITRGSQALPDNQGPSAVTKSWGATATSIYFEQYLSYPATMQRELWQEYMVFNFGMGNRTMTLTSRNYRYRDSSVYASCMEYSNREDFAFDLVLMMLGTNDASHVGSTHWTDTQAETYKAETKYLMDTIGTGSANAQFILMNVPHRCDGDHPVATDAEVRRVQAQTVQELAGDERDIRLYDMERFTMEHLTSDYEKEGQNETSIHEEYYNLRFGASDKTHPSYLGYGKIAEGMIQLVEHLLADGKAPIYLV